jgi:protein-S-isoprenylcysteine O-methyltransferase Ste14
MTTTPDNSASQKQERISSGIRARATQILVMFLVLGLELFLGAGTIHWVWAWVFLGTGLVSVAINAVFMLRSSPETVAERGRPKEVKTWDKWIGGAIMVSQYILVPIVAALDFRFGWTGEIAFNWHIIGAVVYALSLGLTGWAMITNAYFSTAVRIQAERGQQVCHTGPYHYVRHPGYVGFFLQALSVPILLGSLWALLFAIPAGVLIIIRTSKEDRMLQDELLGYREYMHEVKYRLLPGVW